MNAGYDTAYYRGVENGSHIDDANRVIIAKYSDVMSVLKSPDFASDSASVVQSLLPNSLRGKYKAIEKFYDSWFVHKDGEEHKVSRRKLNPAFNEATRSVADTAQQVCSKILDSLVGKGPIDFIQEYAKPSPIYITNVLFGVKEEDWQTILLHSDRIAKFAVGQSGMNILATLREADESLDFMNSYFHDVLSRSTGKEYSGSFIDCIKSVYDESTDEEKQLVRSQIPMLYFGGYTTISRHLGVTLRTILKEDLFAKKIAAGESYETRDIRELLRFDSPLQMVPRMATCATTVGGLDISENQKVLLHLGAANKDPTKYNNPDTLNLLREEGGNLALGVGSHACIGATLAYLQSKTTYNTLLENYTVKLDERVVEWGDSDMMRGLDSLYVSIDRR